MSSSFRSSTESEEMEDSSENESMDNVAVGMDQINATINSTLTSIKSYLEKANQARTDSRPNKHFALAIAQMVDDIRNRKRRRRVQAKIIQILAEARSDSDDSDPDD